MIEDHGTRQILQSIRVRGDPGQRRENLEMPSQRHQPPGEVTQIRHLVRPHAVQANTAHTGMMQTPELRLADGKGQHGDAARLALQPRQRIRQAAMIRPVDIRLDQHRAA